MGDSPGVSILPKKVATAEGSHFSKERVFIILY